MITYFITSTATDLIPNFPTFHKGFKICLLILCLLVSFIHVSYSQGSNQSKAIPVPFLKICLCKDKCTDETIIRFGSQATDSFDSNFDRYKTENHGECPMLYTQIDETDYSINTMSPITDGKNLALNISGNSGQYMINVKDIRSFECVSHIYLRDMVTNKIQDLKTNPTYFFTKKDGEPSERFMLVFGNSIITHLDQVMGNNDDMLSVFDSKIIIDRTKLSVSTSMHLELYNTSGQAVFIHDCILNNSGDKYQIELPVVLSGMYIMRASYQNELIQRKIFLN